MKAFISAICVLLCLFACAGKRGAFSAPSRYFENNGKLKVLSTTAMIDDLIGRIGGEHIDHMTLIAAQLDPHNYELVKGDDEKIAFATLFVGNGLNLEHGASLKYQLDHHRHTLLLGEEIYKRVPDQILRVDGEVDPHLWMDISMWVEGITPIVEALCALDPKHREEYVHSGDVLAQELLEAHRAIQKQMQQVPSQSRYLVTSHDAFHYFTRAYLCDDWEVEDRCMAPEGLAPEGQLSTQDIQRVVDHLQRYQIGVVFPESNVNRDALKKIVASCSHDVHISDQPLYGDAMGMPGSGADTYLSMIQHNAKILGEQWQKQLKSNR